MKRSSSRRLVAVIQLLETRRLLCTAHDPRGLSGLALPQDWIPPVQTEEESVASIDVLQVPNYNSRPQASQKLYLDFNGNGAIDNWNGWGWGGKDVTASNAYDIDGNNDEFSAQELANIRAIWKGVAEKFSPWEIDVTTVRPHPINGAHVVIGGDGAWFGSGGGVASIGGWGEEGWTDPVGCNVAFVWAGQSNVSYVIEAVAHEVGHLMGLHHQSSNPPSNTEYLPGWIMGSGSAGIGRWTSTSVTGGTSSSKNDDGDIEGEGSQADLEGITLKGFFEGFGARADTVANNIGSAQQILFTTTNGVTEANVNGLLESYNDIDAFRIDHPGGNLTMEVLAAEYRGMLNPQFEIRNTLNQVLYLADNDNATDGVGEKVSFQNLDAGTYYITLHSADGYGDLGQYRMNIAVGHATVSFNDNVASATDVGLWGDIGSVGFIGTMNHSDTVQTTDPIDFFRFRTNSYTSNLFFQINGLESPVSLAVYDDVNGDGSIGAGETLYFSGETTTSASFSLANATGNHTYYARVMRGATTFASYNLHVNGDAAPSTSPLITAPAHFDPQPLHGGKTIYDSIDSIASDNTDYFRIRAATNGLFHYTVYLNEGDVRLDVGVDGNGNNLLDAGEITNSSALNGFNYEQIQNMSVVANQVYLARITPQSGSTSANYTFLAVADYAIGGNLDGTLGNARDLTNKAAGAIREYLDVTVDAYDTFKINPMIGPMSALFTSIDSGAYHRAEIIRDANNNGIVDSGEIVATGINNQLMNHTVTAGATYYLRVAAVLGGEFWSLGNYRLAYTTAGSTAISPLNPPVLALPTSTPQTTPARFLGFDPVDPTLTNLVDYYNFTIGAATRFDVSSSDPEVGLQIGTTGNFFNRIAGFARQVGVDNSLSVTLQPGTYQIRAYRQIGERQEESEGGNYTLTYKTAAITDNVKPQVTQAYFEFDQAPNALVYQFNEDVGQSLDSFDVFVETLDQSFDFPLSRVLYDPATRRAMYLFADGILPEGEYTATLNAGAVRDASGNPLNTSHFLQFHVLYGDANRDRRVDFSDLLIVAQNYGETGRKFSQGNFNYTRNGDVNFDDLLMVAQRYGFSFNTQSTGLHTGNLFSASSRRIGDEVLKDE